ncbi:hypothetical protein KUTeg_008278 [Tegillarca granosa]|uniref:Reverse transcriptase domain-containing protein n=1 Tax=Tegillarca granosa TaxID=220873 RepID=A0ABQ9F8R0_TEGGR|nr:hypothetical protein KUTeg_008278 [Tegillarca granosa]
MYETCGKLTGYVLLNGGPGLPMINTILYAFMTEQCIQQNLDVSKIPSTDDLTYIDEILKCSNSDDFQKTIDKHFETIIDQGLQPMKCQFEKKRRSCHVPAEKCHLL